MFLSIVRASFSAVILLEFLFSIVVLISTTIIAHLALVGFVIDLSKCRTHGQTYKNTRDDRRIFVNDWQRDEEKDKDLTKEMVSCVFKIIHDYMCLGFALIQSDYTVMTDSND